MDKPLETEFQGIYGSYKITSSDQIEVKKYRIALLICGLSFSIGLVHWLLIGSEHAWFWFIPMTASLGYALKWIHIYIRLLHQTLQILWGIGTLGIGILILKGNSQDMLSDIASKPILTLLIGPYFAALTGLGFKEFFCFRRPEAIGLTFLLPISLGGHLLGILNNETVMLLQCISAILLVILALRKFGMDAAADIGDKSVFDHLNNQRSTQTV
ncbi:MULTISPECIES: DUF2301 domain-containing membrane protein [Prochlorococcus]|uniref:Uncharacterized conserved membrane protein n=1 Tax=Prochlorococcus marinus (strain SARG / CCMP1375 / SS120) TaxID=167539 RepID=Q7VDW6_PROMA|nr:MULTISPECIES: DUF2301 domain-containing membrane protein [Prochlorococcus]AAP99295.1 Uncharacterized conserved membrane protein [Prochlorococcus marinus subsp. marinus str. CCMP1375]KGG11433.1 hypothetical protein EV04_1512 [Prochlorococcus marinus str. LG]KGG18611.1 hypothetical protein EV08_1859 [Prochlorococcus marinus str. SS2]KGG22884.1 hypothetical protein EV09_1626 [Prochlorococcus marinus str. SS35]KGG32760.1 hypothetical protein EV10_1077 [Prochlorococcus marinus str. SS51]